MSQADERKMDIVPSASLDDVREHMAAIIESSDDAIIGKTLDGIIRSWNTAAEKLFGYSRDEAIGRHISLIIPKDRMDEEFIILGNIKEGKRIEHFETIRQTKDGRMVQLSLTVSPIKNARGQIVGASKIARDITAMKEAERVSAYLAAIIDSSDDAIISKDLNGVITSWNKAAQNIFGYLPEEAVGQHISILIPEDRMDEEYSILGRVKMGQHVEHFETIRRRKDGTLIDISLTISPIRDRAGTIIGVSKIARDVTEQRKIEKALAESNQRKDEFIANISHELRTPMNAVVGLANILSLSSSLSAKEHQYVSTLKQSADSLLVLIDNLLDYSRIDSGAVELDEVEFDLPEIIGAVTTMMQIKLAEKKLDFKVTYDGGMNRHYIGDAFKLQQVLVNLVANAIKFTDKGGVEVNIHCKPQGSDQSLLTFAIADTGIGIAEDKLPHIFDKFVQADATITRKYGGSGLGLAITKGLVRIMAGTIDVQSKPGLGTIFTVEVPFRNSQLISLIDSGSDGGQQIRKKNVLIVDDYEPNIIVIAAALDQFGYDYDTAENGLEAIRFFQANAYDVVLMDVQMHDMDGFESTRRMREIEQEKGLPHTAVIAMTAHVQEKDKNSCLEAGMDNFIPKPFNLDHLKKTLDLYIRKG